MPLERTRERVVYGLQRARGRMHRYTRWRWSLAIAFTLGVAALSLFDVLRFDLWSGRHRYLGRELGLVEIARAFAFPFLAINLLILVVCRWIGRYLCGFACPYGAVARLGEWLRFRGTTRARRAAGRTAVFASCALLSFVAFSFWVDPRVFTQGSPVAAAIAALSLLALAGTFHLLAWRAGLRFCREWCPSGVYFALLGHDTFNGVELAHPARCTDCGACDKACPVDLSPRRMSGGPYRAGRGFYPDGASNFALCLRCGDCVAACEATTARNGPPTPLRMGFLPAHARESSPCADASPAESR